jgi:hypothetical protein
MLQKLFSAIGLIILAGLLVILSGATGGPMHFDDRTDVAQVSFSPE